MITDIKCIMISMVLIKHDKVTGVFVLIIISRIFIIIIIITVLLKL